MRSYAEAHLSDMCALGSSACIGEIMFYENGVLCQNGELCTSGQKTAFIWLWFRLLMFCRSLFFLRRVLSIFHPKTRMENFSQGCGYGYVPDNDNAFSSITKAPFFGTLIISILIMGLGSGLRYIRDVFSPCDHKNANIWKRSLLELGKDSFPPSLCIAYTVHVYQRRLEARNQGLSGLRHSKLFRLISRRLTALPSYPPLPPPSGQKSSPIFATNQGMPLSHTEWQKGALEDGGPRPSSPSSVRPS